MKLKDNKVNDHKISSEVNEIHSTNNRIYALNNNLNELSRKYKKVKTKRKEEEEKEKLLINKIKRIRSKEFQLKKSKEKYIKSQIYLTDRNAFNKYVNRPTETDIENKEEKERKKVITETNKVIIPHNNSMKLINNIELNSYNEIMKKICENKERNKSNSQNELDDNIKTVNISDKKSFITINNNDKSCNYNESFKKEILHHKRIIQIINNGNKVKYSYNFNNIIENEMLNINDSQKRKKKKIIPNVWNPQKCKNKKINVIRKNDIKKDNINNNLESKTNLNDNKDKNKQQKNRNGNIKQMKKPKVLMTYTEKEKEKEKEKDKNKKINTNNKEEENKKIKDLNLFKKSLFIKKNNSYKRFCSTLTKKDITNKIDFTKREYSKTPDKVKENNNKNIDNKCNETNINHIKLEKIKNPSKKLHELNRKSITASNFYSFRNSNQIIKSEKNLMNILTNHISTKRDLKLLKNKSLSFSQSIEKKRKFLGLNIKFNENNIITEKYKQDLNNDEIIITDDIIPTINNNLYSTMRNKYVDNNNSVNINNNKDESRTFIKVTKLSDLVDINNNEKNKNKNKTINNNETSFNIKLINNNNNKSLSANRSIKLISNNRVQNLTYKKIIVNNSKKKDNYSQNITQKKRSMKKLDYFLTDKNYLFSPGKKEGNKEISE